MYIFVILIKKIQIIIIILDLKISILLYIEKDIIVIMHTLVVIHLFTLEYINKHPNNLTIIYLLNYNVTKI